ncbi:hypothetical protein [Nocardioides sp. SYSU D00038]|uniref:hypothetical protein n=1 Tax=Nocardioides sp. SYSU D00038 TaxID=2812554 RepID=UPI0019687DBF|nr:hypothetical protein [Nocardioides sp. SYSU D00038]
MTVLRRLLSAVVTTAAVAVLPVALAAPAEAAACPSGPGVTVVVEPGSLGGGTRVACDGAGAGRAATVFGRVGVSMTRPQQFPGMVCRVDGVPADEPCVQAPPGDRYWGLWWSDGRNGSWVYSSRGVDTLNVPAGGAVAWVWDDRSGSVAPSTPAPRQAASTPTPSGSSGSGSSSGDGGSVGSNGGGAGDGRGGSGATPSSGSSSTPTSAPTTAATPTGVPTPSYAGSGAPSPGSSASTEGATAGQPTTGTTEPATTDDPVTTTSGSATEPDGAVPGWVTPAVLLLLAGTAVGVALTRRRGSRSP